jgi:glucose-1-phosphate thymidylyltransferase
VQRVQGWWKDTGKPEDLLEANQLILNEIESINNGTLNDNPEISGNVAIGVGSVINGKATIRGPVVIGDRCEIGPNTYIGPYTSIGDSVVLRNTEIENSIVMSDAHIDCGKRITDSIIGRNVEILSYELNLPRGHKLILGDTSKVTL